MFVRSKICTAAIAIKIVQYYSHFKVEKKIAILYEKLEVCFYSIVEIKFELFAYHCSIENISTVPEA